MEIASIPIMEQQGAPQPPQKSPFRIWTRRIHIWLGLYFLLFIWLFSLSGLLLNHGKWTFAEFWPNRQEATTRQSVRFSSGPDLVVARQLMQQLAIRGEINGTQWNGDGDRFKLQVARPGEMVTIVAILPEQQAEIKTIRVNGWGVVHMLHTFSGVSMNDPTRQRDWALTKIWSFAMDALAVGLIVLVLTSFYLWFRIRRKKPAGWIILALACAGCAFFVFGLA